LSRKGFREEQGSGGGGREDVDGEDLVREGFYSCKAEYF
jgi:hypothetical protein